MWLADQATARRSSRTPAVQVPRPSTTALAWTWTAGVRTTAGRHGRGAASACLRRSRRRGATARAAIRGPATPAAPCRIGQSRAADDHRRSGARPKLRGAHLLDGPGRPTCAPAAIAPSHTPFAPGPSRTTAHPPAADDSQCPRWRTIRDAIVRPRRALGQPGPHVQRQTAPQGRVAVVPEDVVPVVR